MIVVSELAVPFLDAQNLPNFGMIWPCLSQICIFMSLFPKKFCLFQMCLLRGKISRRILRLSEQQSRKRPNFPVGRLWRAKTFRTKCVNSFFATCMPKVRKSHSRHIKKYVNRSWLSENCPKNYKAIRKLSRLSENFPDCPETFQSFQKLSRLFIYSPDCPQTFQTVRIISILSRSFSNCLLTF